MANEVVFLEAASWRPLSPIGFVVGGQLAEAAGVVLNTTGDDDDASTSGVGGEAGSEQTSLPHPTTDQDGLTTDAEGGAGRGGSGEDRTGFDDGEPGSNAGGSGEVSNETLQERLGLINDTKWYTQHWGQPITAYHEDQLEELATGLLQLNTVLPPELEVGFEAKERLAMEGAHIMLEAQTLGPEVMPLVESLERSGKSPAMAKLTITVTEASAVPGGRPSVVTSIYVQRTTPPTMLLETGPDHLAKGTASRLMLTMLGLHDDDMHRPENGIHYPDVDDLLPNIRFFVQGFVDTLSPPEESATDPDDFSDPEQ